MVGTLRSVEANAKGVRAACAGVVRRHRRGDARLAGSAPDPRHRVRTHAAGCAAGWASWRTAPRRSTTRTTKFSADLGGRPNRRQALLAQMGGVAGLILLSLPVVVFVPVSSMFGLLPAIITALIVAALILAWRLVRHESVQPAVSGFIGSASAR